MKKTLINLRRLLRFIAMRFRQDRCAQIAASLTFATLLSLVPLMTIALTLFSALPVFQDFSSSIREFLLANMLPETGGKMISRYVQQFAESASRLTAVGIVFLTLTAMLMMHTIEEAFNAIWRVSYPRAVTRRILIYWMALTLAPLLIGASLTLTSKLVGLSSGLVQGTSAFEVPLLKIVSVTLTTLAFTLLFRIVPNRHVPVLHACIGGVIAAVAFEGMNRAFGYYLTHFANYRLVYGAFASVPIFLSWIYLSWLTILIAAEITAALPRWGNAAVNDTVPAVQFDFATRILGMMSESMKTGATLTLPVLSKRLRAGFDTLEQMLEKLQRAGMVGKLADGGWSLTRDAEHIRLAELYRLFVLDITALSEDAESGVRAWLETLDTRLLDENSTLRDLLAQNEAPHIA